MDSDAVVADLHMHTVASDGTATIDDRIDQAATRGLDAIAITDHDVIDSQLSPGEQTRHGVSVVTGVEVRADLFDTKIELLGYFVDPGCDALASALATAREYRANRNREIVSRLSDTTGLALSYDELCEEADGELGRPHLAGVLVDSGVVSSIGEAFDRYLGSDGEAFVPMTRLPYRRVIDAIHEAGGVASLAHPGRIRSGRVSEMVEVLADSGLDAIEVWYPYGESGPDAYADIGVDEAAELADAHDLIQTGGSDCHGPESGKFRIGTTGVGSDTVDILRARSRS